MTQMINFFAWDENLRLVDLPGYGYTKAPVSVRNRFTTMMTQYFESRECLKLVCLLLDIRRDPSDLDRQVVELLAQCEVPTALVLTKADKESGNGRTNRRRLIAAELGFEASDLYLVSAQSGMGMDELKTLIRQEGRRR